MVNMHVPARIAQLDRTLPRIELHVFVYEIYNFYNGLFFLLKIMTVFKIVL